MASETQKIYVRTDASAQTSGGDGGGSTGASAVQSVLNLCKVCIGTGALALPFAFSEGGLLFGAVGLAGIAAWNYYASCRLDALRQHTAKDSYASLAEHVFESATVRRLVDVCTIATLTGVCVVYTLTFATLVHATPWALSPGGDATAPSLEIFLCGLLVLPLCVTPHMKFLAHTSALGLGALVVGFGAIGAYGLSRNALVACAAPAALAPRDITHFSRWFGARLSKGAACRATRLGSAAPSNLTVLLCFCFCLVVALGVAAFCFGVPPLQFSLQDAMAQPRDFTRFLKVALGLVWALYACSGVGIAYLYRCETIQENILTNLPDGSAFATGVRLCYAVRGRTYNGRVPALLERG